MSLRLLLLRHGESEWNATGRWQGQADPPLSDVGRRQASLAARALGAVETLVASDLQRATETATIIADELGAGPVILDDGLRERDVGEWSGLTRAEIVEGWPGYLPDPPSGPVSVPSGWEDDEVLLARALGAIARIAALHPEGEVVAVTHGGLVHAVEHHLDAPHVRLANLGGRWFDVRDGQLALGERVLLVDAADATHA